MYVAIYYTPSFLSGSEIHRYEGFSIRNLEQFGSTHDFEYLLHAVKNSRTVQANPSR